METYTDSPEALLYGLLRKDIIGDLIANGIPSNTAGELVKWFDPAHLDYLDRVAMWQQLLCRGAVTSEEVAYVCPGLIDRKIVTRTTYGTYMLTGSADEVNQVHQVAQLLYKYEDTKPRRELDFEAAKYRLSHSGRPHFDDPRLEAYKAAVQRLKPPTWDNVVGQFGPGATADKLDTYARWCWDRIKLPSRIPVTVYPFTVRSEHDSQLASPDKFYRYGITRAAEVPKNLKCNRLVSSEPAALMFAEKAIASHLDDELHRRFAGHVFLHDQDKHNTLLYDKQYASIDLSDASDYVSRSLVHYLLPEWREFLDSARSTFMNLKGDIIPLRVYAPMGSGLTPTILTAVCCSVCQSEVRTGDWHVYLDDIIVPIRWFQNVVDGLEALGLVVNKDKSCCTGMYREACGKEIFSTFYSYMPTDITPCRIRHQPNKIDSSTLELWLSRLQSHGWRKLSSRLVELAAQANVRRIRWSSDLQRYEALVVTDKPLLTGHNLPGEYGLYRHFCTASQQSQDRRDIHIPTRKSGRLVPMWCDAGDYPLLTQFATVAKGINRKNSTARKP